MPSNNNDNFWGIYLTQFIQWQGQYNSQNRARALNRSRHVHSIIIKFVWGLLVSGGQYYTFVNALLPPWWPIELFPNVLFVCIGVYQSHIRFVVMGKLGSIGSHPMLYTLHL